MTNVNTLRLLATTNNDRGDLFNRLTGDLFFALGYDDLRFNVHKTGREIDLQGTHRLEPKRLVAECKAQRERIGGDQINKLRGVVSVERSRIERALGGQYNLVGYYVSLSGFTEAAREQELEFPKQEQLILLDGAQIIAEMIYRRIIIDKSLAFERAGRCAELAGLTDSDLEGAELLGHELGYIWAIYYSQNKVRTHFSLIHADGNPLGQEVAKLVIEADTNVRGKLHSLAYLSPPHPQPDRQTLANHAVNRFRNWIGIECGSIYLDGLPADKTLSAMRLRLEKLFIPLKILNKEHNNSAVGVGEFIANHPRFSLLAKPGGGKSTLLKRLATAYALGERRLESSDSLPERNWMPLFLRCRDLRDRASRPIREILNDLLHHAGLRGDEAAAFEERLDEALRSGQALLLVDGLDEIADEGARSAFAQHLRTFMAIFPSVALVVTSREAGYRQIAGVIAGICDQVSLAPFDEGDVFRLCRNWHSEVLGDNEKVHDEADRLAAKIWSNGRIRALAENPLMLTTLLVVRRSIGDLPTRRVELYHEAVKVLIKTWNTEGFAPMDLEEALAQLSYVAISMMNQGLQRLSYRQLLKILQQSREELQAELQFTRFSPEEFIERIEYRSSLLMQVGLETIDDELQTIYEFRHLTFQEYLAARALIKEQYPGRKELRTLTELLEPHFEDERWREVASLAAVLARHKAEPLIQRLTELCETGDLRKGFQLNKTKTPPEVLLRQCILDEVQIAPIALHAALSQLARLGQETLDPGSIVSILRGKFSAVFRDVAEAGYFGDDSKWSQFCDSVMTATSVDILGSWNSNLTRATAERLLTDLKSGSRNEKVRALFTCCRSVELTCSAKPTLDPDTSLEFMTSFFHSIRELLTAHVNLIDPQTCLAAVWALAATSERRLSPVPPSPELLLALNEVWKVAPTEDLREFAAWALSIQPLLDRHSVPLDCWGDCDDWIQSRTEGIEFTASLVLSWYRRRPWTDSELVDKIAQSTLTSQFRATAREMLGTLGEPGASLLKQWNESSFQSKGHYDPAHSK